MVPNQEEIRYVSCDQCGRHFTRVGRAKYCSAACKQAKYRLRRQLKASSSPARRQGCHHRRKPLMNQMFNLKRQVDSFHFSLTATAKQDHDYLPHVIRMHELSSALEKAIAVAVAIDLSEGVTWPRIARYLDISENTARRRYYKRQQRTPTPAETSPEYLVKFFGSVPT